MDHDELLSQDEIDALLNGSSDQDAARPNGDAKASEPVIKRYDPSTQHRVVRGRLDGLDMVNQRFARDFRVSLFNLLRRSADITVDRLQHQAYKDFIRNVPVPTNLNLITMKPLRGSALMVFPPNLIYMVVDNLFGGDGRFMIKSEGREFTNTEQRIIRRLLDLATEAYQKSWRSIYPVDIAYLRSEVQAKFVSLTSSPNEIILVTTFNVEVGNLSSYLKICLPYSMIEPIRERIANPTSNRGEFNDALWHRRMASRLHHSEVELVANFTQIPASVGQVKNLAVGDVLPIELPEKVFVYVDNVPVLEGQYGSHANQIAVRVERVFDHRNGSHGSDANEFIEDTLAASKGTRP